MRELVAGFLLQVAQFRAAVGRLSVIVAVPFYVLIFLSITRNAGRSDLDLQATLAPFLASMWTLALVLAGDVVAGDKREGTLEPLLASPGSVFRVILGRVTAVGFLGLFCAVETLVVAVLLFGVRPTVAHPGWFALGVLVTCLAMAGTSNIMAGLFVLGRAAVNFQNALNYPFYVLGGVFVPVAFLPGWLRPVSDGVFLSWSSDLLRDSLSAGALVDPGLRVAVIVGLGAAGVAVGWALQAVVLVRIRRTGAIVW
jgi:ABC-2 type transport system permease protein